MVSVMFLFYDMFYVSLWYGICIVRVGIVRRGVHGICNVFVL